MVLEGLLERRLVGVGLLEVRGEGVVHVLEDAHDRRGSKFKDSLPNLTPISRPHDQTLEGLFSSASKPIFAPKYVFVSIFRELQDLQSFAPLYFQNLIKIS